MDVIRFQACSATSRRARTFAAAACMVLLATSALAYVVRSSEGWLLLRTKGRRGVPPLHHVITEECVHRLLLTNGCTVWGAGCAR